VTFHNPDTGFCVLRLNVRGHRDLVSLIGSAASVAPGEYVTASGRWETNRDHGLQFRATLLQSALPSTVEGIERYLGSGLIKGIGPAFAKRLVRAFGEQVFDVVEKEPERLTTVDGIGPVRAKRITSGWTDQRAIREIMVFLQSHGVGTSRAVRIFKTYLKAQVNKSDRNDARGIAQMMRVNLFRPVHVKTLTSQKRRALLTARKLLQEKAIAIENDIRGLLRNFGLKVGAVGVVKFEERIREFVEGMPELTEIIGPLLAVRQKLRQEFVTLHRKLLAIVRDDRVCRRLMTIPGVGPVVSLAFSSTIDVPARFKNSKAVGPALGLTPILNQSGESNRVGRISLCGDGMMRTLLYEAAQVMLTRVTKWSWLKAWAMNVARRRGLQKAIVALARRLAVIMHRIWSDGTEFRWTKENAPAAV
jgi:transposase